MTGEPGTPEAELNLRDKLASIDRQLAERDRRRQEIEYQPRRLRIDLWKLIIGAATTGAALLLLAAFMLWFFAMQAPSW